MLAKNNEITFHDESRYVALFSYAQGSQIDTTLSKEIGYKLGSTVADLHQKMNGFECQNSRYEIDLDYLINEPLEMLTQYCTKYDNLNIEFFYPYAQDLYKQLEKLKITSDTYGLIHADLNPSNIHIDENDRITIFDFDHCGKGWRIHDLAVIKLCFSNVTYENILNGYDAVRQLTSEEEKLIGIYSKTLLLRKFKDVLSMMKIYDNTSKDSFDEKEYLNRVIESLHSLMA